MPRLLLRQGLWVALGALIVSACTGAESRKASFVAQGEKNMAAHEWQKARLDFRNALQIDPQDQAVQLLAARAAERAGDYDEAAGRYQALLEQDGNNVAARTALGRLYAGGGLAAEAIKLAEEGLATHPDDAGLLTVRGVARAIRGDTVGAGKDAEAALVRAPTNADTAALAASVYQRQGRREEALAVLRRATAASPDDVGLRVVLAQALLGANRADQAEKELLETVRIEPRELKHRYRLAQFYVLQKDVDAAEKTLRAAVAAAPEDIEPRLALANLVASQRSFETGESSLRELVASDPKNLILQLGLGGFYETHQRPALAEEVYRKVVAAGGTNAHALAARNRLAALSLNANRSADASALIDDVLKASPRDNDALTMRASIAIARGNPTNAIADLRAVLRDQPNAPGLMRALAAAYASNRDTGLAEETLRTAMRVNPSDIQTRLALADLLIKNGRGDEAKPLAEQVVADQPADASVSEAAFRVHVQRRDFVAARKSALEIRTLRPDLPAGDFLMGLVDEAEGNLTAAVASFERASRLAPGAVGPLAAAIRIDLAQGQGQRAMARVDHALAVSPDASGLLELKAEVLAQLKRFDEAVDVAKRAIARAPGWWVAYDHLARAELGRNRSEAAVAAYQQGLQATRSAPPLVLQLAGLLERLGRIAAAAALYEDWLKREPASEVASNNLAMLLITHKASDAASLDRALQVSQRLRASTRPESLDTLGWVHYTRGEYASAIEALQRSVAAAPNAAVFRAHLGLAQFRAGQRDAAKESLQRAISSPGQYPELAEARSVLAHLRSAQ